MTNWQSNFATVNGIRIHYTRTGGDKPALVLLHGITDSGLCWRRTAIALESDYDIIMVDARGHGLSDKPATGYTANDYAGDIAGLIESLGVGPALVMGHSLGGMTTATLAANHPQLVRGAVLEDPPWRDQGDPQAQMKPEQEAAWMADWRSNLIAQQKLPLAEIIAAGRERSPKWHADEFPDWAEAKVRVNPGVLGAGRLRTWDDLVPMLACPTLLVTGDPALGAIVTSDLAARVCGINPQIDHVHIADAGHNIRRENFAHFLFAVRGFLGGIGS